MGKISAGTQICTQIQSLYYPEYKYVHIKNSRVQQFQRYEIQKICCHARICCGVKTLVPSRLCTTLSVSSFTIYEPKS